MNQNDINLVGDYSNFMEEYIDADLEHYGVPKMRWHHRRWQYPDGSLTPAGRDHYGVGPPRAVDPEHPITSRMAKAAQGFKERRAIAKIYAEKEARDKRLQDGKKAAKLKREQRAKEVKEMTRTPDDLVKNRDKLTDEEFNAAVEKFERLKKIDAENKALLKKYNGLKDETAEELDPDTDDENEEAGPLRVDGMAHPARKYQNPDGTLTEEGKDKFLNNGRAEKVAKMTRTAELLVANRSKLTDEEFAAAKERLMEEKRKRDEDTEILATLGTPGGGLPKPLASIENSLRKPQLEKYARTWDGKKLLANRGQLTKGEFEQLKMQIASKSLKNMEQLDSVLSNEEYQTAYENYFNRSGKVKRQKQLEFKNGAETFKTALGTAYDVIDTTSKLSTGRTVQDLARVTLGRGIMGALESTEYGKAVSNEKLAKNVEAVSATMVKEMDQLLKRAGNLDDEQYVNTLYQYYDTLFSYIQNGNNGNKPKKPKGGGGGNP